MTVEVVGAEVVLSEGEAKGVGGPGEATVVGKVVTVEVEALAVVEHVAMVDTRAVAAVKAVD